MSDIGRITGAVVGSYAIDTDRGHGERCWPRLAILSGIPGASLVSDIVAHGTTFLMGIAVALFTIEPNSLWEQIALENGG